MKLLVGAFLIVVVFGNSAQAQQKIGSRTQFEVREYICNFSDIESRRLEVKVYSKTLQGPPSYALVNDHQVDLTLAGSSKNETTYHLNYIDPGKFSLVFRFENKKLGLLLEVLSDDMGRMSSWQQGEDKFDLTCASL